MPPSAPPRIAPRTPLAALGWALVALLGAGALGLIALQESARAILIPVELRFDKAPDGRGVAVMRVAVVDGRTSEVRWMGDVRSTPAATFSRDILTSLVAHTADLIAAP